MNDAAVKTVRRRISSNRARPRRDARLEFRLSLEARERIEKAAALSGQSLSDFASSTLLREADARLEQHALRTLSERDWQTFVGLLQKPPQPNRTLKAAAARYTQTAAKTGNARRA